MTVLAPRRVRFIKAEVRPSSASECVARVELHSGDDRCYVGTSKAGSPEPDALRAAAEAAARALVAAAGPEDHELQVDGAEVMKVFGKRGVIVHLTARRENDRRILLGFCVIDQDAPQAAAMAVLNATNRFFDVG